MDAAKWMMLARTRFGTVASLFCLCMFAAECKGRTLPPGQCEFNSDCDSGLLCAGGFCRAVCNSDAGARRDEDCRQFGTGWRCLPSGQMGRSVCLPPGEEGYCVYHSECAPPLVCNRDGRCGPQCRENRDCVAISLDPGARCLPDGTCSFRDAGAVTTDATQADAPAADVSSSGDAAASNDRGGD